jgi:hypothetical protein
MRPPKPMTDAGSDELSSMTDAQKRQAILGLDPLERKVGLYGSALAGLIALSTELGGVLNPKMKVNQSLVPLKGHICSNAALTYDKATSKCTGKLAYPLEHWVIGLSLLLAFALALFVTVRMGRRGPVGFVALMTGFAFETQVGLLGFPFIAAGGWLLIRAWRVQKYGSPTATKMNPSGDKRPPPAPRERRPARAKKSKGPIARGPAPNKRYTPKVVKKKRPAATPPGS